jgi:hypothetical protein
MVLLATMDSLSLLDVVALLSPCGKVPTGAVGTIVEFLAPEVFLVDFSDDSGRTLALEDVPKDNLLKLHYDFAQAA